MAQKPVAVTVNPGVGIQVDTSKVKVEKGVDIIEWKSTTKDQQFGIVLPPGEPSVTSSSQGNKFVCTAGPFSGSARTIKYSVTASNAPTLDPDIEIFP